MNALKMRAFLTALVVSAIVPFHRTAAPSPAPQGQGSTLPEHLAGCPQTVTVPVAPQVASGEAPPRAPRSAVSAEARLVRFANVPDWFQGTDGMTLELGTAHRLFAAVVVLAADLPVDCDMNGIDDRVEVRNGTAPDLNNNGVPDVCERPLPLSQTGGALLGSGPVSGGMWTEGLGHELLERLETGDLQAAVESENDLRLVWCDAHSDSAAVLAVVGQTAGSLALVGHATTYDWLTGEARSRRVLAVLKLR